MEETLSLETFIIEAIKGVDVKNPDVVAIITQVFNMNISKVACLLANAGQIVLIYEAGPIVLRVVFFNR